MIQNPIIPGFSPDPSILRVDDDYYIATSTFEWMPAIRLHHSRDLAEWKVIGHVLDADNAPDLNGIPPAGGVWAPNLTRDTLTGIFYVVYSVMKSQTGEMFDVDNFVVTASSISGPWSTPTYLNSIGFDPSLFHDDDGRKWLTTLEWDPRDGYEHPGAIVLDELDPVTNRLIGHTVRISRGTTDRGCLEAPQLYKREGYYYLMTAEGGTGFGHGVALGRSKTIEGPYVSSPVNPIITSWPTDYFGRNDRDFLRSERMNPQASLQKSGHGSLVDTPAGEWFIAHLSARPDETGHSILGRETSLQKMEWTDDGWLRMSAGGRIASSETAGIDVLSQTVGPPARVPLVERFQSATLDPRIATLRRPLSPEWADLSSAPGTLRMKGGASLFSLFDVSLLATPITSHSTAASVDVEFEPTHFSQSAGLVAYYDNTHFHYLRLYWSESLGSRALGIMTGDAGVKSEHLLARVAIGNGPVRLAARLESSRLQFSWSQDGRAEQLIGGSLDATMLSDEYVRGFTGASIGLTCQDAYRRESWATFTRFDVGGSLPAE